KGAGRPRVPARDRALALAALRFVDAVTVFDEPTPLEIVEALHPDVLVKGADYRRDEVVGAAEVESWGGRVVLVPLVGGRSTSGLLARPDEA
ncbi:MAG: bifunctional heptose 7-phosphate kinase/heptose 1-phosphate adenyltransferase, partial [Gemmatimonadota bacterium]